MAAVALRVQRLPIEMYNSIPGIILLDGLKIPVPCFNESFVSRLTALVKFVKNPFSVYVVCCKQGNLKSLDNLSIFLRNRQPFLDKLKEDLVRPSSLCDAFLADGMGKITARKGTL